ncbi:hypothetical protein HK101_005446, partial [Irineochytrium annulatum]
MPNFDPAALGTERLKTPLPAQTIRIPIVPVARPSTIVVPAVSVAQITGAMPVVDSVRTPTTITLPPKGNLIKLRFNNTSETLVATPKSEAEKALNGDGEKKKKA